MWFAGIFKPALVLAAFAVLSGMLLAVEISALDQSQSSLDQTQVRTFFPVMPLSITARQGALAWCEKQISPPLSLTKTAQALNARAQGCETTARTIMSTMPTYGYAHFVAALAAATEGRIPAAKTHLDTSANLAPAEGWLAQRRTALAFRINPAAVQNSADIDLLLTTQAGAEFLARHYARRPNVRGEIAGSLQNSANADQTRFVNLLRKEQEAR